VCGGGGGVWVCVSWISSFRLVETFDMLSQNSLCNRKAPHHHSFKLSVVSNNNMADFGNFVVGAKLLAYDVGS